MYWTGTNLGLFLRLPLLVPTEVYSYSCSRSMSVLSRHSVYWRDGGRDGQGLLLFFHCHWAAYRMGFHLCSCRRGCRLAACRMNSGWIACHKDCRRDCLWVGCRRGSHMAYRMDCGLEDPLIDCAHLLTCLHCWPRDRDDQQRAGLRESLHWYMHGRHWAHTCWLDDAYICTCP